MAQALLHCQSLFAAEVRCACLGLVGHRDYVTCRAPFCAHTCPGVTCAPPGCSTARCIRRLQSSCDLLCVALLSAQRRARTAPIISPYCCRPAVFSKLVAIARQQDLHGILRKSSLTRHVQEPSRVTQTAIGCQAKHCRSNVSGLSDCEKSCQISRCTVSSNRGARCDTGL
ncbi:hypothetical protein BKA63DRAFT_111643 [Paraphoma chrysanthemicola]|nr:hypothetical protein BKA63DRAFT_111643 [Paraphoma chrysanthemicola]